MRTIYLVWAQVGDYDEASEYCVRAYVDSFKADDHAARAEARAKVLMEWKDPEGRPWGDSSDPQRPKNEYDPNMAIVSGEPPRYTVFPVELDEE